MFIEPLVELVEVDYFLLQPIFTRIEFLTMASGGAECRDDVIV